MAAIECIRDELHLPSLYVTHEAAELKPLAGAWIAISRA
jgi:ABC-type molybdate transport system ATPase subunit